MRWAKVPEWLLDELVAIPRGDREGVAPGTALAAYVALGVVANFKTGEVRCTPSELALRVGVTERAARRTLALLDRVGALQRSGDRLWLLAERADVQVRADAAPSDVEVRATDVQVRDSDVEVRALVTVPAGHGTDPAKPPDAAFLSEQPEGFAGRAELHLIDMPEGQMELSEFRENPERLVDVEPPDFGEMRATARGWQ